MNKKIENSYEHVLPPDIEKEDIEEKKIKKTRSRKQSISL